MFAAVARYLANVAGPAGTLLRVPGEHPLRVVAAYRSTDVRPPDPLLVLLADLGAAGLAGEMQLFPLAPAEASALLQSVMDTREDGDATLRAQVVARTGGVPYFLVSCAQALRISQQEGGPAPEVPWNVTQSIRQRVAALPETAQDLLGAAAVVGREMPGALLLIVAAQPPAVAVAALEELDRARLLVEGTQARYQFPHDLIREVVLNDLSALRRRQWHAQVAGVLEQGADEAPVEQLAYHYARAGVDEKAVIYLERAGDRALALHANAEAENYYRQLVECFETLGRSSEAARVYEQLGTLLSLLARNEQAIQMFERALALYQRLGDMDGQGRTTARMARMYLRLGKVADGIALVEGTLFSLQKHGPSLGLAELYTELANLYNGRNRERVEATWHAEASAPAAYLTPLGRRWRLERVGAFIGLGRLAEARAGVEELLAETQAAGDIPGRVVALFMVAAIHLAQGNFPAEQHCLKQMLEIAERTGNRLDTV